ncbi:MAG: ATP-dependent helicase [Anaeroplasmataceae bacterium]|nr:ATP-dependent helicase [Anaeroplasmataceae bacterium]
MHTLNPKQQYAVQTPHKKVLILAGAGTGKTTVLTHRIFYLLQHNMKEEDILAFTFTNKAANQMKTKLETLLGKETKVILSTFHSFCYNHLLIPDFYQALGFTKPPEVILDSVKSQIIKTILHTYDKDQSTTPYVSAISKIKNNTQALEINPQDKQLLHQVYQDYNKALKQSNTLDFDDMIPLFLEAIRKNDDLLQMVQYPYILVDECQDINPIQYDLIQTLSQTHQNIYMVGDEDQLIYSFRSSNLSLFKTFHQQADITIILNQNYRSTQNILTLSNRLISNNKNRTPKTLISTKESQIQPIYNSYTSTLEEAKGITQIIKTLKVPLEDIAILYRNNNQSYPIEKELKEHNIPYTLYGSKPFFETKEIKIILYTYRFLFNPNNEIALRIIYPSFIQLEFYIYQQFLKSPPKPTLLEKLKTYSNSNLNKLGHTLSHLKEQLEAGKDIYMEILEALNYITYLKETHQQKPQYERLMSFKQMLEQSQNLEAYFNSIILNEDSPKEKGISLLTLHKAKGLEYNTVFLISCNEGIIPSPKNRNEKLEEERRLMYVGITRAKERLYLSYSLTHFQNGRILYLKPSPFLLETKEEMEDLQTYFGNHPYHK